MKQDTKKLTAEQRIAQQARIAALRAEANAIAKALRKDEAADKAEETPVVAVGTTEEVVEAPIEEAEVAEEVTETPVEEAEVTEEVTETPVEEAEVTEEVTETPVEEAEVTEEVTETPVEEAEVTEEVTETPVEEAEVAEEVTETPVEEAEVAEEVTETSEENAENHEENDDDTEGIAKIFKWLLGIAGVAALVGILIMLMLMHFGKDNNQLPDDGPVNPDNGVVDTTPGGDEDPGTTDPVTPVDPAFDMDAFVVSVENIAKTLTTDENIATNVDVFVEKIGEDKLVELVNEYGELTVQKAIAEYLAFAPEIKMNQYIKNNGLDYNPNYLETYDSKLLEADAAYKNATGKNANGALMSLEGYDTYKANKEAMKALIEKSGDTDLLTWYITTNEAYNVMKQQKKDTAAAEAYKEEVKLELVNNVNGSVNLVKLQLEQKVNGTNVDTLGYTEVYEEFIITNYMYVVAN